MTAPGHLDSEQRHTLEHLSSHPLPPNVKWPQVVVLLHAMEEVTVENKDRYRVTIDGRTGVFRPPHHHGDIPRDMVVRLRHFLRAPRVLEVRIDAKSYTEAQLLAEARQAFETAERDDGDVPG